MGRGGGNNDREVTVLLRLDADGSNPAIAKRINSEVQKLAKEVVATWEKEFAQTATGRNRGAGGNGFTGGGGGAPGGGWSGGGSRPGGGGAPGVSYGIWGNEKEALAAGAAYSRQIDKRIREDERAARAQETAITRAHKTAERANKAMEGAFFRTSHAALGLGHAFALSGLAGEKSSKQIVEGLIKIEAGFGALHSGLSLINALEKAWQAYTRSVQAAAAAQALAGLSGAAGGAGGAAAGGAARAAGGALGGAAAGAAGAAGASRLGFLRAGAGAAGRSLAAAGPWAVAGVAAGLAGTWGIDAVQAARGVPESKRFGYSMLGGADAPVAPSRFGLTGIGATNGLIGSLTDWVYGGRHSGTGEDPGAAARRSAERVEKLQKARGGYQQFDAFTAGRMGIENQRYFNSQPFAQDQVARAAARGQTPQIIAAMQASGRLPYGSGFDQDRALAGNRISQLQNSGAYSGAMSNLTGVRDAMAATEQSSAGAGPEARVAAEEKIARLRQQELDLVKQVGALELDGKRLAKEAADIRIDGYRKSLDYLQQGSASGRAGHEQGAIAFGNMSAGDQARALRIAGRMKNFQQVTPEEAAFVAPLSSDLRKLGEDAAMQRAAAKGFDKIGGTDLRAALSNEAAARTIEEKIKLEGEYKIQVDIQSENFKGELDKKLDEISGKITKDFEKAADDAFVKMQREMNKAFQERDAAGGG